MSTNPNVIEETHGAVIRMGEGKPGEKVPMEAWLSYLHGKKGSMGMKFVGFLRYCLLEGSYKAGIILILNLQLIALSQ